MEASPKRVLVVDDEPDIVEVIESYLLKEGYLVSKAGDGLQALALFERLRPSLVILDLMLPGVSGEEVCQKLRKNSRVPIIMLTARVEEDHIIEGLKLGADDYVTKPFSPKQLMARVEALLRRASNEAIPLANRLSFNQDELQIDHPRHEVWKNKQPVNLTPTEYNLLLTLVKYPKKVFTREELVTMILGAGYDGFDRTIDAHVKNLRQKVEPDPKNPKYILTVHGIGYKFGGE
ncbi:MAG: response regulator transcription factor [Firmicutes bacterium]|nr:response regulator transcription factor [Bacillota bacterium]